MIVKLRQREFITLLGCAAAWPLAARAQQAKLVRLGLLDPSRSTDLAALRDLGYVEGRHFQLEQRVAEGHFDRLPGLARELAGLPVAMFLVGGEASIRAAMQATDQIPIIKFDFNPPVAVPTPPVPTAGAGIAESGLPKPSARWAEWFGVAGGKMQLNVCKAPMQSVSCLPAILQCHNVAGRYGPAAA
jgi:hypothetical protein